MAKRTAFTVLFACVVSLAMAQFPTGFDKQWERLCGVKTSVDDVRTIAVWKQGNIFVTIDRYAPADGIKIYNQQSGLPWVKQETVKLSGDVDTVPSALYALLDGDFTDDGKLVACSLSYAAGQVLNVYIWDDITTGPRKIYTTVGMTNNWLGYRVGDALDAAGSTADNSAVVLVSGNAVGAPLKLTTADNGRTWTPSFLGGTVQCTDIEQVTPGGDFWAIRYSSSVPMQKYNSNGVSYGAGAGNQILNNGAAWGALAVDSAQDLIYAMGVRSTTTANNWLRVYKISTSALVAEFNADPLDILGAASGSLNGSAGVEVVVSPGGGHNIYALSERNGCARYVYSTVVTVPDDYASIQGAITAFNVGGALDATTVTLPLQIAVKGGVYDEAITLRSTLANGNIAGDLMIKGVDAPTTLTVVKLQTYPGTPDDGLHIYQDVNGVSLKNLVICPSQTTPVTDDLIKIDENDANAVYQFIEFWNVVITEITASGDPMVTDKAGALVGPPPASGSAMASGDFLLVSWNDPTEATNLLLDNVVIYGAKYYTQLFFNGLPDEEMYLNDCLVSWSANAAFRVGTSAAAGSPDYMRISGTDAGAGPLSSCAFIENEWHAFYGTGAGTAYVKIDNMLAFTTVEAVGGNDATGDARGWSGGAAWYMQMRDSIISVPQACVVDSITNPSTWPATWERCTLVNNFGTGNNSIYSVGSTAVLTMKDCVLGGPGTKLSGTLTTGVDLVNCNVIEEGPQAITALQTLPATFPVTQTACTSNDPAFANTTNLALADLLDVRSQLSAGKSSTAGALVGGADYIGDVYPQGSFAPSSYDFGTATAGDPPSTTTIVVGNTGVGQDLYVNLAKVGADDFSVLSAPASLAPGTTDTMIVQFAPQTEAPSATFSVVNTLAPATLTLSGTVLPPTRVEHWRMY